LCESNLYSTSLPWCRQFPMDSVSHPSAWVVYPTNPEMQEMWPAENSPAYFAQWHELLSPPRSRGSSRVASRPSSERGSEGGEPSSEAPRRWADIELEDDEDPEAAKSVESGVEEATNPPQRTELVGRAAKRQRQRERRKLGWGQAAAERADASAAERSAGRTAERSEQPLADHFAQDDGAILALPLAEFETTREFEEYRVAYRQFRLGYATGAKGEVADTTRGEESQNSPGHFLKLWRALNTSLSLVAAQS